MVLKIKDFNLTHTFECGQCFRWNENADGSYTGVAFNNVLNIKKENDKFILSDSDVWENYLDLNRDYNEIKKVLSVDPIMKKAISDGYGIRLLNQEFFETVISFIFSQNNNIPRIKSIVENFCRTFGEKIENSFYAFPAPETLKGIKREDLGFLKCGYRDLYIIDAIYKISNNEIDFDILKNGEIDKARKEICKIKGIGPKVADCILLFSLKRSEVFPTDVWMKKVLTELYGFSDLTPDKINAFAKEKFGSLSGYAQQYLFYSIRDIK